MRARRGSWPTAPDDTVVQDLTVTQIGDEAVHLRANSTDNVVRGLTISDTGLRRVKFGEGIYVGSAVSNWCDITDCEPDRSDRNVVVANTISRTAAESVDIKEGTTGGVLADNTFDGAGMRGETDSWVDVKGNGWLVQANHGTTTKRSGFEVNLQADGWGTANTFDANTADVDGPGYGYELRRPTDDPAAHNRVTCTNTAIGAAEGLTNTICALTDHRRPPPSITSDTTPKEKPMNTIHPTSAHPTPTGEKLTVGVVGLGYLGAVHAAGMAALGHRVVGYDVDAAEGRRAEQAKAPFFEPGLEELLAATQGDNLLFTHDMTDLKGADVVFVAVGTPQRKGELAADTSYVVAAVESLAELLPGPALIVGKSTVPVGTAARLAERLAETAPDLEIAWNPEFLREGHAVDDTLRPDRLVFGVVSDRAEALLRQVYARPIAAGCPVVVTDRATAELVKVAANSFLATKISFINAMAEVAEAADADVETLADAIGYDDRIGRKFLNAGLGFGGGCLPKDIRAFMARAGELGADQALTFLREVDTINLRRRSKVVELAREACGGSFIGRRIAVLGAAFKPHSDDIRDSPALNVAAQARLQGADVVVTDPAALRQRAGALARPVLRGQCEEAVAGADVVVLATEWPEYAGLNPKAAGPDRAGPHGHRRAQRARPRQMARRGLDATGASGDHPISAPGKPPDTVAVTRPEPGPRTGQWSGFRRSTRDSRWP